MINQVFGRYWTRALLLLCLLGLSCHSLALSDEAEEMGNDLPAGLLKPLVLGFKSEWNVSTGNKLLTPKQVTTMDLDYRRLNINKYGEGNIALVSSSTETNSGLRSAILAATYTRASKEVKAHVPVSSIGYLVQSTGPCFSVAQNPPVDNWNAGLTLNEIATLPYGLAELAPNGSLVRRWDFPKLIWQRGNVQVLPKNATTLAATDWFAQLVPTKSWIRIMSLHPAETGVVSNFTDAPMLPKAWLSTIELEEFSLLSNKNHLELELVVASRMSPGVNTGTPGLLLVPQVNNTELKAPPNMTLNDLHGAAYVQLDTAVRVLTHTGYFQTKITSPTFAFSPQLAETIPPVVEAQQSSRYGTYGIWSTKVVIPENTPSWTFNYWTGIGDYVPDLRALHPAQSPWSNQGNSVVPNASSASSKALPVAALAMMLLAVLAFW